MDKAEKNFENLREHFRIDVEIPLSQRIITEKETENLTCRVIGYQDIMSESSQKFLSIEASPWAEELNAKLDLIIGLLLIQQHGFHQLPKVPVNLSAGGLRFSSSEEYKKGDILEIKIYLDVPIPLGFYLYSEVVKSERKNDKFETAVKFIKIDKSTQDLIARYVLYKQKQMIKLKKD